MENTKAKKHSMGRQKIEIKKIERKTNLQVTFSKRRMGLFKKIAQLNSLYGVNAAVFVVSPGGKLFVSGTPSAEHVINMYNNAMHAEGDQETCSSVQVDAACSRKCEKGFKNELGWLKKDIDELGLEELEEFKKRLVDLKQNLTNLMDSRKNETNNMIM